MEVFQFIGNLGKGGISSFVGTRELCASEEMIIASEPLELPSFSFPIIAVTKEHDPRLLGVELVDLCKGTIGKDIEIKIVDGQNNKAICGNDTSVQKLQLLSEIIGEIVDLFSKINWSLKGFFPSQENGKFLIKINFKRPNSIREIYSGLIYLCVLLEVTLWARGLKLNSIDILGNKKLNLLNDGMFLALAGWNNAYDKNIGGKICSDIHIK
jgi:hypothetical protein